MVVTLVSPLASAQPAAEPEVCTMGRPGSRCFATVLAEVGLRYGYGTEGRTPILTMMGGVLFNQGRCQAWGFTIGLVGYEHFYDRPPPDDSEATASFAASVRYRRWLFDYVGLDISLGGASNGPIAEIAFEMGDMIAFTVGAHTVPVNDDRFGGASVSFGMRIGLPAIVGIFKAGDWFPN